MSTYQHPPTLVRMTTSELQVKRRGWRQRHSDDSNDNRRRQLKWCIELKWWMFSFDPSWKKKFNLNRNKPKRKEARSNLNDPEVWKISMGVFQIFPAWSTMLEVFQSDFCCLVAGVSALYDEVPTTSMSSSKAILSGIRRAWCSRWQTVARSRRAFPWLSCSSALRSRIERRM